MSTMMFTASATNDPHRPMRIPNTKFRFLLVHTLLMLPSSFSVPSFFWPFQFAFPRYNIVCLSDETVVTYIIRLAPVSDILLNVL